MNKIIYIRYLPLTKKIVEDFYMNDIVSYGYEVEYWDITPLFFPNKTDVEQYIPSDEDNILIKYIHSKKELRSLIRENTNAIFISLMTFEWNLIFIFRFFKKYRCKTAVFSYYPLPLNVGSRQFSFKLLNVKRLFRGILNRIAIPLSFSLGYIKLYDYVFKGGDYGWKGIGNVKLSYLKDTKFYDVNNWDYDKFVNANLNVICEPFIVFLDEYYPFHPDALMFGGGSVDPKKYYDDMNKVFSLLEEFYSMPVVVAAHPKALKYKEKNYFDGRKVLFNSSMDLVSRASLVVAHDSLSIGYAVMCNKSIVFVCSNEIRSKLPRNYLMIRGLSDYFHSPLLEADHSNVKVLNKSYELPDHIKIIYENLKDGFMSSLKRPIPNAALLKMYFEEIFKKNLEYENICNIE